MNARAEANRRLENRYEARVLEPSPPTVADGPWFADDPVARGQAPAGRSVVSPVGTGDLSWEDLVGADRELAEWCADRWLGAYRRLGPAPAKLVPTRIALHRLAEQVVSPARRKANGKIGLRYTRGGFGTPFFGPDLQVRVHGAELVVQDAGGERSAPITTLAAAAKHIGADLLPDDVELDHDQLDVDPAAAAFLGDWYGFAASLLEELRAGAGDEHDPSRVQLWPEHFDLAVELGSEHRVPAPRMAAPPATGTTPSHIYTSRRGSHPPATSCGRRPGSVAPSWAMPSCSPPRTSARPPWRSCTPGCTRLPDDRRQHRSPPQGGG